MYIDKRTWDLFGEFPRDIGNPFRLKSKCRSREQFEAFVQLNSGVSRDVFTSVYPSNHTIDKLFFDFDCSLKKFPDLTMNEVFNDFCTLYSHLVNIGEHPYPIISGKKGYQIQIPLIPSYKVPKEQLWLATVCLLYDAGLIWIEFDKDGVQEWHSSRAVDSITFGDIEQLCRITNTPRVFDKEDLELLSRISPIKIKKEDRLWCTWLPTHKPDVRDMSVAETFEWAKRYHLRDSIHERTRTILSFITHDLEFFSGFKAKHGETVSFGVIGVQSEDEDVLRSMLRPFIPESIITRVIHPKADQDARFITALAMLSSGLPLDFVVSLLSQIGWYDWSEAKTRYQVNQIKENLGTRYKYRGNYEAALLRGTDRK